MAKLTRLGLRQLIKEELQLLKESWPSVPVGDSMSRGAPARLSRADERLLAQYKEEYSGMTEDDLRAAVKDEPDILRRKAMNSLIAKASFGF